MKNKILRRCNSLLFLCLAVPAAHADIFFRLDTGNASLSDSRYDSAALSSLSGGYNFGPVNVTFSTYDFDTFTLNSNRDAELELDGTSIKAFWVLGAGPVKVDLGGGLFDWESKAKLHGRVFGRDSGTSTMLEAGVRTSFDSLGIYLNAQLIKDLSGEDLTSLSGGIQFSF